MTMLISRYAVVVFLVFTIALTCMVLSQGGMVMEVEAVEGVDLSYFQGNVSLASMRCLREEAGKEFIIIQATKGSSGSVNPYVVNAIINAKKAGFKYVDVYVFLNFKRGVPAVQMQEVVHMLKSGGVWDQIGMIWHDVEAPQYWGTCAQNQQFMREAMAASDATGKKSALYASKSQWDPIMCGSTAFSHYQVWYPHYDNKPNFSDWVPFGGWSKPAIKQYKGTTNMCGTQVDLNFY